MTIRTEYVVQALPIRFFDWIAVDDEPGHPVGCGSSEQEAIADLLERIDRCGNEFQLTFGEWLEKC
jgi:hypothetical protein